MFGPPPPLPAYVVIASVFGLTAALLAVAKLRDGERGMGWFAISAACMALFAATSPLHAPLGPTVEHPQWNLLVSMAVMALAPGFAAYFPLGRWPKPKVITVLALAPAAAALLMLWILIDGSTLPRWVFTLLVAQAFLGAAVVAGRAQRIEPGAGHGVLATTLGLIPAAGLLAPMGLVPNDTVRAYGYLPALVLFMLLLSVGAMRRRRALETEVSQRVQAESKLALLNRDLETRVASRTQDLAEIVDGLESFNRSVSHDLRGPLGGMAGLARMAHERLCMGDVELARRALPTIADQSERGLALVQALLTVAHASGRPLQLREIPLRRLCEEVVVGLRIADPRAPVPAITVNDGQTVCADPDLLAAALGNLIGNAMKFSREAAAPEIEVGMVDDPQNFVLYVRDNGVGFDAEQAGQEIFSPFVRRHDQTQYDGHGVGLNIVRRAIGRHGGRTWARSQAGEGATFFLAWPRETAPNAGAGARHE